MAEMKKYNKMKRNLLGGTVVALLGISIFSYATLNKQNTQVVKDRTMSIASGLVDVVKYKELDTDEVTNSTLLGSTENGNNYAYMLGNHWKTLFPTLTNDSLLVLAKDFDLADITIYDLKDSLYQGVLSTQPNKIGDKLDQTDEEKEIQQYLLKAKEGEKGILSNNLQTFKTSISSSMYVKDNLFYTTVYTYVPELDKVIALSLPLTDLTYFQDTNNTDKTIEALKADNPLIVEIGVLDVSDYTPQTEEVQTLTGTFKYSATTDNNFLAKVGQGSTTSTYVQQVGEKQLFKHFEVLDENRVIYVGLDYSALLGSKSNSHLTIMVLILLATAIIGVLHFLHFKKDNEYHTRIKKRLTSLIRGKYHVKPLETSNDEYKDLLTQLNELTEELATRKETTKEPINRLNYVIAVLTNGEVRNAKDLNELRYELKSILQDIQVILKIED